MLIASVYSEARTRNYHMSGNLRVAEFLQLQLILASREIFLAKLCNVGVACHVNKRDREMALFRIQPKRETENPFLPYPILVHCRLWFNL